MLLKLHGCVKHPENIILTREHYLRFAERSAALLGIVQAAMSTKHMLFVGFGLTDLNFLKILDVCRQSIAAGKHGYGTSISLWDDSMRKELVPDLRFFCVQNKQAGEYCGNLSDAEWDTAVSRFARRHDVLLDLVACISSVRSSAKHLLDARFVSCLSAGEQALAEVLRSILSGKAVSQEMAQAALACRDEGSPAWDILEETARQFGATERLVSSRTKPLI